MTHAFWTGDTVSRALGPRTAIAMASDVLPFAAISTDTRTIAPGDIFVALVGERFDGHDFISDAIAAGARALIVSRDVPDVPRDVSIFRVDDTLVALGSLARFRRLAWGGTVIAVAGSNGKTSTKELLRAALSAVLRVHATTGNLNNRIGVPLTLLSLPFDTDVAVVEVGTSIPGEIAILRDITRPDIAIVTSIAEEHLQGFGDLAGVLREESSIFHGVSVGIVPADDPALAAAANSAGRLICAGLDDGDIHASGWKLENDGTGAVIVDDILVRSRFRGVHNLRNLMLAVAAAREVGVDTVNIARGVAALTPPPMRANWQRIGRALIINDAYNANPGSAVAAIEMLDAAPGDQKVAIVGSMLELGDSSDRAHDGVARVVLASTAAVIAGMGEFAAALIRVAPNDPRVVVAGEVDELWSAIEPRLDCDATILLKASRGAKLERVLPYVTDWASRAC